MNTKGLLDLGVSEVVNRTTGKLIGYAFTEPNGKGFFERWLLFENPNNDFEVRSAPAHMASWSLGDWQEKVAQLWQPESYYVWAQADVYRYGETYDGVKWTEIPPATHLPSPSFPERPGVDFQLDYGDQCVQHCARGIIDVVQHDKCGHGFVIRGLSQETSVEFWTLSVGDASVCEPRNFISEGAIQAESLDAFVNLANSKWREESVFIITACVNYHGKLPPFGV